MTIPDTSRAVAVTPPSDEDGRRPPVLSIVSTLYRSAETVRTFIERSAAAAVALVGDAPYEIVLVNDGSPDDSLALAATMREIYPALVLVDLSRNFGHHPALLEGLRQARGELVYLIDSDLEEEPEWLERFHDELRAHEADVVYGYQDRRKGRWFERLSGRVDWAIFRGLSGLDIPPNLVTCRLMTRRYVDAVLEYGETEVSIGGIFSIAGFEQVALAVAKGERGTTTYSLRLKVWHLVNSVSSFSTKPLNTIFVTGIAVSFIGLILLAYLLLAGLFWNRPPEGWTSVMASVWLLGGFILSSLGVIAIYLGKVFTEVKQRPRTVVRSVERTEPPA